MKSKLPPLKPLAKGEKPYKGLMAYGIKIALENMPSDQERKKSKWWRIKK